MMVYGKIPPQAKDLEEAILGGMMMQKGVFDVVAEILDESSFYVEAHQLIYNAMCRLNQKSMPIDSIMVAQELMKTGEIENVGGLFFINKLTLNVTSTANVENYARIVLQKYIQRELIRISAEIMTDAYEDSADVFDMFDKAEACFYNISSKHFKSDYKSLSDAMPVFIDKIETLKVQKKTVTGVTTGYQMLDNITHGWQPTDLIIIAARPSVGKTAFALNLARNAAKSDGNETPVGLFSLEMGIQQLLQRVVSNEGEILMERLSTGRIDDTKVLYKIADKLQKMPIYVDDSAALTLFELRAKARRMVSKHKVGLIIIDYLQLMSGDGNSKGNREQEISGISRGLKKMAKDLNVPVVALSQLSREVEKRAIKEPQLSDLRESGAIEQDADLVAFLYNPPEEGQESTAIFKIAKNRHGTLDQICFRRDNSIQKWTELGSIGPKGLKQIINEDAPSNSSYSNKIKTADDEMPF